MKEANTKTTKQLKHWKTDRPSKGKQDMEAEKKSPQATVLIAVRTSSVLVNKPLPYDLFLKVGRDKVHFRKRGDSLTKDRLDQIKKQGGDEVFFIPEDQKHLHLQSLRDLLSQPEIKTEEKSRMLKEAAFVHVHDLFSAKDIKPVVNEAKTLVEDMVSLVSTDMAAVSSLLNLSRHDYYTYNHSVDVAVYSIVLAKRVFGSDEKDLLITAGLAGLLHDIGKRGIDKSLINKKSDLSSEEWQMIRKHPEFGHEYVKDIPMIPEESKLAVLQR